MRSGCTPARLNQVAKTQVVRVLDVVLVGPLMILGGERMKSAYPIAGNLLSFFGVSTIVYNARNWWMVSRASKSELRAVLAPLPAPRRVAFPRARW